MRFYTLLFIFLVATLLSKSFGQYKVHYPNKKDYTSFRLHKPRGNDGFVINASVVALFTSGVADRSGFRIGMGFSVGYQVGDWTFTTGLDTYKALDSFRLGTTYASTQYLDRYGYGGSYYLTHYYQGDVQTTGSLAAYFDELQIRFENDIFASPFTGFKVYDRYRTAALEFQYRNVLLGTNIYTTDTNGMTDVSLENPRGVYKTGKHISSPIYAGYTVRGLVARLGWNNKIGGNSVQNLAHRKMFNTSDFQTDSYNSPFVQLGANKPYTLY